MRKQFNGAGNIAMQWIVEAVSRVRDKDIDLASQDSERSEQLASPNGIAHGQTNANAILGSSVIAVSTFTTPEKPSGLKRGDLLHFGTRPGAFTWFRPDGRQMRQSTLVLSMMQSPFVIKNWRGGPYKCLLHLDDWKFTFCKIEQIIFCRTRHLQGLRLRSRSWEVALNNAVLKI